MNLRASAFHRAMDKDLFTNKQTFKPMHSRSGEHLWIEIFSKDSWATLYLFPDWMMKSSVLCVHVLKFILNFSLILTVNPT